MRILLIAIACLFLWPASNASSQIDWDHFFDHDSRDLDDVYTPPPLPTTTIAEYTFEGCTPDGWTSHDVTTQAAPYFHVDDFSGLPAPYAPLSGAKSLWCGARPGGGEPLCTYATLPGYGNRWAQYWTTGDCLPVSGNVDVSFAASWDTEAGYDATFLEFDGCDDNWTVFAGGLGVFDGTGTSPSVTVTIPSGAHGGNVRVRFRFESDGAWSDEDGLLNTNGAIIIDNLAIDDAGGNVVALENFEGEAVGALASNDWEAGVRPGRGDFAALYAGATLVQEDPVLTNVSCVWAFISGSTVNYACGGHAGQTAVPYVAGGVPVGNEIRSPWIPFAGPSGYATTLKFQVYRDLPRDNLIFYQWWVREFIFLASCPSPWKNNNTVYFSDRKDWYSASHYLTPYISASTSADQIQVALRVVDMSLFWTGTLGSGACHSHAPLFDNVRIVREFGRTSVPRMLSFFQDGFSEDGTLTGTVRVDGVDSDFLSIQIADASAAIDFHIPGNPQSGPAVYCHVKNLGGKGGAVISGGQQWPVVGTTQDWTVVQMAPGSRPHEYTVDLNDQLYTPGDRIEYYFSSRNKNDEWSYWTSFTGHASEVTAIQHPMEMTCLPTPALPAASSFPTAVEVLYVDAYSGLGAQPLIESAMSQLGLAWDRFDRNEPLMAMSNGLGNSATFGQIAQYSCIIWDTGDIYGNVFTEADYELMLKYLDQKPNARLFLAGDNAATALASSNSPAAINLRANYFHFALQANDHHGILPAVSPALTGVAGSPFDGLSSIAYVGDAGLSQFDLISPAGSAFMGMTYEGNPSLAALVFQQQNTARTALACFSLQAVRDDTPAGIPDRTAILNAVLNFFGKQASPVGATPAERNFLAQNVPNPFNPSTTIAYSLSGAGSVRLRIYDVAGRQVRTLLDEQRSPAGQAEVVWDGRNDRGAAVASGVYFYRLEAGSFVSTRKMVLLK